MARLTRAGSSLVGTGLGLLGLGLAFGNLELLALGALPLLLAGGPLAARLRGRPSGMRSLSTRTPHRGEALDVTLRVELPEGTGIAEVHQPLPASFSLEEGSNLAAFAGRGKRLARFRACAHGRGAHELGPLTLEILDPAGVVGPQSHEVVPPETVEVTPRSHLGVRRRARAATKRASQAQRQAARLGITSTDFREVRDYAWGDPPKAINWKATAKRLSGQAGPVGGAGVPLVNEFEREGRRTVVILLDGGPALRVGTTRETGLDHGSEAALSAGRIFLDEGARVGAATFHAVAGHPSAPDAGSGQLASLERALSPGEVALDETPARILEAMQPHLAGTHPTLLVVTRVTPANVDALVQAARRLRVVLGERRRRLPFVVVDVDALHLVPARDPAEEAARALVRTQDARARARLGAMGARIVPWRPGVDSFRATLLGRMGP